MPHILFITHGGGPWPIFSFSGIDENDRLDMLTHFQSMDTVLNAPKALLVVSAHWESNPVSVNVSSSPHLYFDYHGFPEETYHLSWPVKNDVVLAHHVISVIEKAGIPVIKNERRGYDHGVFIPLMAAYPKAHIPIVEISIHQELDVALHLRMGQALSALLTDDVALITSGNSYHNIPKMFHPNAEAIHAAKQFDAWIVQKAALTGQSRWDALCSWKTAPYAQMCHPKEDHLIPLMVAAGAAGNTPLIPIWKGTLNGIPLTSLGA